MAVLHQRISETTVHRSRSSYNEECACISSQVSLGFRSVCEVELLLAAPSRSTLSHQAT